MAQGRLENEFCIKEPSDGDALLFYRGNDVLITGTSESSADFPLFPEAYSLFCECEYIYLFALGGRNYFMPSLFSSAEPDGARFEGVRGLYRLMSKEHCFAAMTGKHLYYWYKNNRFCGACGEKTCRDTKERMLFCPKCGNMIYPRINPAVIIGVTDKDRLLMSRYAGRLTGRTALIAGYTEIGETLEQTVIREVKEETGLDVCNIRYYKSQPWGIDGNILTGFFCDLKGDDTIKIDESELSFAGWFRRDDIVCTDEGISLTEEMIAYFKNMK